MQRGNAPVETTFIAANAALPLDCLIITLWEKLQVVENAPMQSLARKDFLGQKHRRRRKNTKMGGGNQWILSGANFLSKETLTFQYAYIQHENLSMTIQLRGKPIATLLT